MNESIERMRKLVNDNLVMGLRFQMNRELNKLESEIEQELNSRAERTCKPLGTIRYDYEGGYAGFEYETELSCGHKWRDAYGDYPDYCPNCGARVVDE